MRTGREPTKPPSHENISISISVNLRKQGQAKRQQLSNDLATARGDQPTIKRQLLAETTKPVKSKLPSQARQQVSQHVVSGVSKPQRSARTFSQAVQTARVKTGQTVAIRPKKSKLLTQQTKKKPQPRKKSLSNDPVKRRKNSGFVNKSVENLNRPRYNKSLSRTPIKSSKSKSKERDSNSKSSGRRLKRRKARLEIEDKYINTFENDPKKIPQSHKLPLEEMEHLVSKYKKETRVKHSTSIEPSAVAHKKKGHRKNPTLEEKIPKKSTKVKQKESLGHSRSKERNRSKSAKNSFTMLKEEQKPTINIQVNERKPGRDNTYIFKLQSTIRSFLARRQIEEWKKQQIPVESSLDEVHLTDFQESENLQFVHDCQQSENSLRTVEQFDHIPEGTELLRMIQGLSKQSKGHPLEKQLTRIVEEAKKREQQHQQILRENQSLRAMISINMHRVSEQEEERQTERQKQLESLKNFKQQFGNRFNRLSGKNIEMLDIDKIEADNQDRVKKLEEAKPAEEKQQVSTSMSITGIASPRNIMSLLREKEKILGDKHQKEVEVLSIMLQKQLVSPKTFKTKLTALDLLIEEERSGLERSKREAERLSRLIRTIRNDKQQIDRLDNVCRKELWNDAKDLVRDIAVPDQSTKPLYETEPSQMTTPIDRGRVDKIFNTFEVDLEGSDLKSLPSNDHIQIINMEEQYHRQQPTVQTQNTETDHNISVNLLPSFKTDIYFIKEYCTSLCQYILEDTYLRVIFLANIQTPMRYDRLQFLSWYRQNTQHKHTRCYNMFKEELIYPYFKPEQQQLLSKAISKQMFAQFNSTFQELKLNEPQCNHTTIELQQVFLDAILAGLNESFNYERPCAQKGEPEPWLTTFLRPRHHGLNSLDEEEYLIMCARAINRLIDWSTFYCGTITEHVTYEKNRISEQQQQKIRDTRLTLMMERTVEETERQLLDCQQQTTEVKLELAEALLDFLVWQCAGERLK